MTDKTPPTLDRLWEDIPAGPAPIAELLDAGLSATRRRRRAVIAGVVAATTLVLGLGGLTAQVLGLGSDRSSGPIAGTSGDLSVSIAYNDGGADAADPNPDGATHDNAVWDQDTDVVYYASGLGYSGSCPPTGTARRTDAGVLTLHLAEYHGGGACTSDAREVIAAIHGVTHMPAGLRVTELGETRDVTVQQSPCGPNDVCEKATADTFVPDCHQDHTREQATFDIFDDTAAATPGLAVAPMLAADERASATQDVDAGMVRIALFRADGTTRAVVTVERIETGWRPYTIDGCPGEMLGR